MWDSPKQPCGNQAAAPAPRQIGPVADLLNAIEGKLGKLNYQLDKAADALVGPRPCDPECGGKDSVDTITASLIRINRYVDYAIEIASLIDGQLAR